MQRLYLFRHGIAVPPGTPDVAEDDRPLTPRGERRVRQVAYGFKSLGLKLDKVVTSPLPRAFRTAEILARVLGKPDLLEAADALRAEQHAPAIADWLSSRPEERLMLVGHNPALSALVGHLVAGPGTPDLCEIRRAGLVALSAAEPGAARMTIDWIARPRLIRRLSDR